MNKEGKSDLGMRCYVIVWDDPARDRRVWVHVKVPWGRTPEINTQGGFSEHWKVVVCNEDHRG